MTMSSDMNNLWDPGQEWIQIFDNLLKHPQESSALLSSGWWHYLSDRIITKTETFFIQLPTKIFINRCLILFKGG